MESLEPHFTRRVENYIKYRPRSPQAMIELLMALAGVPARASIAATAEATTLPEQSIDVITVGQALHWFDLEKARRECLRILVPGGWVMLVWNRQRTAGTPFLVALESFWQTYFTSQAMPVEETYPPRDDFLQCHSCVKALNNEF